MSKQLTMVVNGIFMVGELKGNQLLLPRVFSIIEDGKKIQLQALPFVPLSITLTGGYTHYPIQPDQRNLIELWEKVTDPELIRKAQEQKR